MDGTLSDFWRMKQPIIFCSHRQQAVLVVETSLGQPFRFRWDHDGSTTSNIVK